MTQNLDEFEDIDGQKKRKVRFSKKVQFTHCDICGKPLGEEDIAMGAANHKACWLKWVEEKRAKEPPPDAEGEGEETEEFEEETEEII